MPPSLSERFPDLGPQLFVFEEPPSTNPEYGTNKRAGGKRYKTDEARLYAANARKALREQKAIKYSGEVAVCLSWIRANRRGDAMNREKVLIDACKGILWEDDRQIALFVIHPVTVQDCQPHMILRARPYRPEEMAQILDIFEKEGGGWGVTGAGF